MLYYVYYNVHILFIFRSFLFIFFQILQLKVVHIKQFTTSQHLEIDV